MPGEMAACRGIDEISEQNTQVSKKLFRSIRQEKKPLTSLGALSIISDRNSLELWKNKLNNYGAGFFVCSKAEKRRNTLCISSFSNAFTGGKDKPECSSYFVTVP